MFYSEWVRSRGSTFTVFWAKNEAEAIRIRFCLGSLDDQLTVVETLDGLPFENASLFKPLGGMLADDLLILSDELSKNLEEPAHDGIDSPPGDCIRGTRYRPHREQEST